MAQIHFIVDPVHPQIGQHWPKEQKRIEQITRNFDVHILRGRNHGEALVRKLNRAGAELIVSVGGDSTIHELCNGLYPQGSRSPLLSIHPDLQIGDFRRHFKVERPFLDFLRAFLEGRQQIVEWDAGLAEYTGEYGQKIQRIFVNYAGFGLGSSLLNRIRWGTNRFQMFRLIAKSLPFYRAPLIRLTLDDNEPQLENLVTAYIMNIEYAARGFKLSSTASPTDGEFEIIKARRDSWLQYLRVGLQSYLGGRVNARFLVRHHAKSLKIESTTPQRSVRMELDGESRGFLPMEIKLLAKALRFAC